MYFPTGCLNEGKSIARAVWQKEQGSEEQKEVPASEEKNMAEAVAVTEESEVASRADTDVSNKSRGSYSNFRNTIVYGLPHITLIPSTA